MSGCFAAGFSGAVVALALWCRRLSPQKCRYNAVTRCGTLPATMPALPAGAAGGCQPGIAVVIP